MIFYFTGTGNSLFAAKKLAGATGSELVNMAEAPDSEHRYVLKDSESVGFIFPVYFYSVNDIVQKFISNLTIEGTGYTYAVITCGGSIGASGAYLKELLAKRGIELKAVFSVVMPDNCLIYYSTASKEKSAQRIMQAEAELEKIAGSVLSQTQSSFGSTIPAKLGLAMYHCMNGTKKFHATDKCTGCGKCERNCPSHAIKLTDGRPVWTSPRCIQCLGCINRCPAEAIEFGKKTAGRTRFENTAAWSE